MKRFSVTSISPACKQLYSLLLMFLLFAGMGRALTPAQEKFQNPTVSHLAASQAFVQLESPHFLMPRAEAQIRNVGEYHPLHHPLALTETSTASLSATNVLLLVAGMERPSLPGPFTSHSASGFPAWGRLTSPLYAP